MNSNEIQDRQNEKALLKIQYAAKKCYNSAEKANGFVWIVCVISALSIFLPNTFPAVIVFGVPLVLDLAAFSLMLFVAYKVKTAAQLRKYFDAYVLNINLAQFSETELRRIKEVAGKIYSKNLEDANIQMVHTGSDSPPGVYDWYVFPLPQTGINAQFECQRQNTWWNSKMSQRRLVLTGCGVAIIVIVFGVFMSKVGSSIVLLYSAGFIIKIFERLIENIRYIIISNQIDGAQRVIEAHPSIESIELLQNFINERRSIIVLELNWLHKKTAETLTKEYEDSIT